MNLLKNSQHYALAGCLLFAATNVFAVPIVFNTSEYSAFADVEVGDNSSGLVSRINPPDTLPLLAFASLANGSNSASASGSANTGQLNVSNTVSSLDLFAGATSGAGFEGEFTGTGGRVNFLLDFLTRAISIQASPTPICSSHWYPAQPRYWMRFLTPASPSRRVLFLRREVPIYSIFS